MTFSFVLQAWKGERGTLGFAFDALRTDDDLIDDAGDAPGARPGPARSASSRSTQERTDPLQRHPRCRPAFHHDGGFESTSAFAPDTLL